MSADAAAQGKKVRLGILLSGRGSNFLAIAESIRAGKLPCVEIAVVISNIADAPGIAAAAELGLPHAVFASKGRSGDARSVSDVGDDDGNLNAREFACTDGFGDG